MYRNCIFCSGALGSNESIHSFRVGRKLAFDAWKGRLWVVCPSCARWNLSPLEERWEAVEEAEKLFRDVRLRVQRENIGLARLPDGTHLIRVGEALPGELAAWRYSGTLLQRRKQHLVIAGAVLLTAIGGSVAVQALTVLGTGSAGMLGSGLGGGMSGHIISLWNKRQQRKLVHRIAPESSPTGAELLIRRWHMEGARLAGGEGAEIEIHVPDTSVEEPRFDWRGKVKYNDEMLTLRGTAARSVLSRAMVHLNEKGATHRRVQGAIDLLAEAATAEAYLRQTAQGNVVLGQKKDHKAEQISPTHALALEMALNDETERRAMEGDLALLESAWREAEEIAAIADLLPTDPLTRLRPGGA